MVSTLAPSGKYGVTDIIASMTSQHRYLPFGQVRTEVASPNSQSLITDYGYTGQRNLDEGIGLMDYKARFYSPVLNRFIQPDSIVPDPSNPQAWNRFSYVVNSPINLNDPSGHVPIDCMESGYCGSAKDPEYVLDSQFKPKPKDEDDEDSIIEGGGYNSVAQPENSDLGADDLLFYSHSEIFGYEYSSSEMYFGCAFIEGRNVCTHKYFYVLGYEDANYFRDYLHDLSISPFIVDSGNPILATAIDKGTGKASLFVSVFLSSIEDVLVQDYDRLYDSVANSQNNAEELHGGQSQTMYITVYDDPIGVSSNGTQFVGSDIVVISANGTIPVTVTLKTNSYTTVTGLNSLISR